MNGVVRSCMDIIEKGGESISSTCEFERAGLDGNVRFDIGIFFAILVDVILV